MRVDVARNLDGALDLLAERPTAVLICGGTRLMVEINFRRKRPESVIAIDRLAALRELSVNHAGTMGARDELVTAVEWEDAGPAQVFMKVGTRNAMVIAVAGLALVADRARRRIGIGLGSVGPTILRAPDAEAFAAGLFADAGWQAFTP